MAGVCTVGTQCREACLCALVVTMLLCVLYMQIESHRHIPVLALWQRPAYTPLWVIERFALLVFQCTAAYAAASSLKQQAGMLSTGMLPS